jgi:hypothetical protein
MGIPVLRRSPPVTQKMEASFSASPAAWGFPRLIENFGGTARVDAVRPWILSGTEGGFLE